MTGKFCKSERLLKRKEFLRFAKSKNHYAGEWILVSLLPNTLNHPRLGITVTKRFGNACKRNRFKRIVREAFRLTKKSLPVDCDIIVRPRSKAYGATSFHIRWELSRLCRMSRARLASSENGAEGQKAP